jgi:transcriptional regulator of nitric oxide reductase
MGGALAPVRADAKVYYSQREGLELAFPDADRVERRSFLLDDAEHAEIEQLARARMESRIVAVHVGWQGERLLGYAVIDVHNVRTVPEALMIVLTPEGTVRSVHILAFHEPTEYQPPERWLARFRGAELDPELQLGRGVHGISGATLSVRATTASVRRALATYRVLIAPGKDEPDARGND